ncbi:MAG: beta-aspartyl-peptidase [Candidatus Caldatribacteriota bacterium]
MFIYIKNGIVYAPDYQGKKDILICMDKIVSVYENGSFQIEKISNKIHIIDAKNMIILPGFIDQHMHFLGGGGKFGYAYRAGIVKFDDIIKFGITTAISSLGVDSYLKSLSDLLIRAKELEARGLNTYILTGGFQLPLKSITNSIFDDLIYIEKVLGVGEIGIADEYGSQPTAEEIIRIVANTRAVSSFSEKPGKVLIHLGSGKKGFEVIYKVLENADLLIDQFIVTHINRSTELLEEAIKFAKLGGIIDITTGISPELGIEDSIPPEDALEYILAQSVSFDHITFSSDSGGFRSIYDNNLKINDYLLSSETLFKTISKCFQEKEVELSKVLKTVTSNVARIWNLKNKGEIKPYRDADLVLLDQDFKVKKVICLGKIIFDSDRDKN